MKTLSMEELITGKINIGTRKGIAGRQKPSGNNSLVAYAITHARKHCVFYAGSNESAKAIFRDLKNNLEITHHLDHYTETQGRLMLKNGTSIQVIAINSEHLFRGLKLDAVAVYKDCQKNNAFVKHVIFPSLTQSSVLFRAVSPFSPMLEDFKPAMIRQSPVPIYEG